MICNDVVNVKNTFFDIDVPFGLYVNCQTDTVTVENLEYILNEKQKTATVVGGRVNSSYLGRRQISIPYSIVCNHKKYRVTEVGEKAFCGSDVEVVTYYKGILLGFFAFGDCKNLDNVIEKRYQKKQNEKQNEKPKHTSKNWKSQEAREARRRERLRKVEALIKDGATYGEVIAAKEAKRRMLKDV
jgi:hypothetical protein